MKALFCFCCILFFKGVHAQNRIFYSSSDLANVGEQEHGIAKIKIPWGRLGTTIRINYADGCEAVFGKRAIWGFEKDGRKLRLYEGEIFEIVDSGVIVLYKSFSPHPVYYFSEDFNSDVVLLERPKPLKVLPPEKLVLLWKEDGVVKRMF